MPTTTASRSDIAAWILMAIGLYYVLRLHLLPALLAGLLVFQLVHTLAPRLRIMRMGAGKGKVVAIGLLATIIVAVIVAAAMGLAAFLRSENGSLPVLLQKMADILENARQQLPEWAAVRLPDDVTDLKLRASEWLREHSKELQTTGKEFGHSLVHILIGLVIGGMVSLQEARSTSDWGPFAKSLAERVTRLGEAFRRIVFAQVRISALNTALTAIFLWIALPMFGIHLPLVKTMIAVTFFVGLLPVIGNLISNTVIVVIALSYSLTAAIAALVFLIVIHKLEYFINARIVGTQIRAHAWELLLAMLVMESAFGVIGVVAAPIYYAYIKDELVSRGWV
jgi:predicted PurR-regulated permease PerM